MINLSEISRKMIKNLKPYLEKHEAELASQKDINVISAICLYISPRDKDSNFFIKIGNCDPIYMNGTEEERVEFAERLMETTKR